jgi:phosphohistidine phosphatase SixA
VTGAGPSAVAILVLAALALAPPRPASADEALVDLLRAGGQVIVMRHAATDRSVGDPPGFRLDDCSTQRNLSEEGRAQARRVAAAVTARGIPVGRVLSSQWCRCLETARLAFGSAEPWAALNSFFRDRTLEAERTSEVRAFVSERPATGNLVLVTHALNIGALTGVSPAEGELVVLTPLGRGGFRVAGTMRP